MTEDRERLDAIRMEFARSRMEEYLAGMETLGFTRDEAKQLLMEEA